MITTETHPYAVELLNSNLGVMNTIRSTTEKSALWNAENLTYLLGRENKRGEMVTVIVAKKWNGDSWEIITETEY